MKMKNKLVSLAAATVIVATMTGCESTATSDSVSKTGATATHISNPKGSVTGTVQDTNGNPIAGVMVYLAGQTAKTDAGGVYNFSSVPVTQTTTTGVANVGQALSVTIAAPTGYIGATVTVTPAAQIDNAEAGAAAAGATNAVETFIDGYVASAGVAVLPALSSTVNGVLRDTNTGEPLANKVVNLEFTAGGSTAGAAQEQVNNAAVNTSYAVELYTVTTGTDGSFSMTGIPTDSTFALLVPGYTTATAVVTDAEDVITLGNVNATVITALDGVNPYITRVNNTITTGARAILDDNTRDTFVVNFSETLTPAALQLAGNSILLYAGDSTTTPSSVVSIPFTATIDAASKAITITTSATLADGDNVDIFFLNADAIDSSANPLGVAVPAGVVAINYAANNGNYTQVNLQIFQEANINAASVTGLAQMTRDDNLGTTDDDAAVQAISSSFNDVLDEAVTTGFQQLNSADNDAGPTNDAQERLSALVAQLNGTAVQTNAARVTFTPDTTNPAFEYYVLVTDVTGTIQRSPAAINAVGNIATTNVSVVTDFGGALGTGIARLTVSDINAVELYISNVQPTDTVTIIPTDSLGYAGTTSTISLVDNVAPTTILQDSYYAAGTSGDNASGAVVQYGNGGELSDENGAVQVGTPYLAITNSLLDNENAAGDKVTTGEDPDETLKTELFDLSILNGATGLPFIGATAYDATAFAAFNVPANLTRTMGVAFSENIKLTGTPTYNGTGSLISGYVENNDVTKLDTQAAASVNADLVNMDVSNVMTLGNIDHLKVIDYSSAISDLVNNPATNANAKVVVKDEMAPMVTEAKFNGDTISITFNEDVILDDGMKIVITSGANSDTITYAEADTPATWTVAANVITIQKDAYNYSVSNVMNDSTLWTNGTYVEAGLYGDANTSHALLSFNEVPDTLENSWDTYNTNTGARSVTAPKFAVVNTVVNPLGATPVITGFSAGDNTTTTAQTVVWTFNQPLRVTSAADIFNDANINNNSAEADGSRVISDVVSGAGSVATYFEAFIGAAPDAITDTDTATPKVNTKLTLSPNGTTMTLVFTTTTDISNTTNDGVRMKGGNTLVSEYDKSRQLNTLQASPTL